MLEGTGNPDGAAARQVLLVFVGLQLGQVMSSVDGTIVVTALPTIVDDIGGLSRVTWVMLAYSLAVVASMPLYGKLGDLYGRKRMFMSAIAIFLSASVLCGAAQSMEQLLAARFVQGLGGGGLGVLAMAALADVVPARRLGRWLGYQGIVYAVASVAGPIIGGLFVDHLSWRWAFYVNLPVGVLSAAIVGLGLRSPRVRIRHRLDVAGAGLLTAALAALVVLSSLGGVEFGWVSPTSLSLGIAVVTTVAVFVGHERRTPEPVLPLGLFASRVVRAAAGVNITSGLLYGCAIFFVPIHLQEVLGFTPFQSGLALTPLLFGAATGTAVAGRVVERRGRYRSWPIAGGVLMTVGLLVLAAMREGTPVAVPSVGLGLVGLGVGFVMQPSLLAAQNASDPTHLGTVTSTTLLTRSLGSTIGTPILGGILNAGLAGTALGSADFSAALRAVFLAGAPVAVASIILALLLEDVPLRDHLAVEPAPAA